MTSLVSCSSITPTRQTLFPEGRQLAVPCTSFRPGPNAGNLSPSFLALLAKDGINLATTGVYGKGLGNSQKNNFAPRIGLAYQFTPKLVVRAGFGIFYNGFENRGFSPNLGENYPFQFNFSFGSPNDVTPITFPGCASAGPRHFGDL